MDDTWRPSGTQPHHGPPPAGRLLAYDHAVWRVVEVTYTELNERAREIWVEFGMPDLDTWRNRPYRMEFHHVAGARPDWALPEDINPEGIFTVEPRRGARTPWNLYPTDQRWPMCSCCGEPRPCRAQLQDAEVGRALDSVELFSSRLPGSCWGCGKPIVRREQTVAYPGENLDLPGGIDVVFHSRYPCGSSAASYELRWLAEDPRRERILSWPRCGGMLYIHPDQSSECYGGTNDSIGAPDVTRVFGPGRYNAAPGCEGNTTHSHNNVSVCYHRVGGCPLGHTKDDHAGIRNLGRPPRRVRKRTPVNKKDKPGQT